MIQSTVQAPTPPINTEDIDQIRKRQCKLVLREKLRNVYTMTNEKKQQQREKEKAERASSDFKRFRQEINAALGRPAAPPLLAKLLFGLIDQENTAHLNKIKHFSNIMLKDYSGLFKVR